MTTDTKAKNLLIRAFVVLEAEFSRQCDSYRLGNQTDREVLESERHEEIDLPAIAELKTMRHLLDDIEEAIPAAPQIAELYALWGSGQMPSQEFLAAVRATGMTVGTGGDLAQIEPLNG